MQFILKFLSNWFIRCICNLYGLIYIIVVNGPAHLELSIDHRRQSHLNLFFFIIYKLSHTKNKSQEIKIKIATMPFYDSNNERLKLQFIQVLNLLFPLYTMNKNLRFVTNG